MKEHPPIEEMKTFGFRLNPTQEQQRELIALSVASKEIWNHFVEHQAARIAAGEPAWSAFDMHKLLTQERAVRPQWQKLNSKAGQRITSAVDFAYRSYRQLIKKDKTAKPPQTIDIDENQFYTLVFNQSGWSFKNGVVVINKLPIEFKGHLPVHEMDVKELRIKKRGSKWLCDVCVEENVIQPNQMTIHNKVMAVDMGLSKLATGVDSQGKVIVLANKAKKISAYYAKIIDGIKAKQATKTKNSRQWKHLQKRKKFFYAKKTQQVKHALHAQSKFLLSMDHNTIVIGDIQVKKLMALERNKKNKVSRSFGRSNLSMFMEFLSYKAIASSKNVIRVNEWNTTQINCLTGKLFEKKIELSDREVLLSDGLLIDRDLNSAINIYRRWHENHIAAVAPPVVSFLSSVLERNNLLKEPVPSVGSQRL